MLGTTEIRWIPEQGFVAHLDLGFANGKAVALTMQGQGGSATRWIESDTTLAQLKSFVEMLIAELKGEAMLREEVLAELKGLGYDVVATRRGLDMVLVEHGGGGDHGNYDGFGGLPHLFFWPEKGMWGTDTDMSVARHASATEAVRAWLADSVRRLRSEVKFLTSRLEARSAFLSALSKSNGAEAEDSIEQARRFQ